jgi:hypothetical protein
MERLEESLLKPERTANHGYVSCKSVLKRLQIGLLDPE